MRLVKSIDEFVLKWDVVVLLLISFFCFFYRLGSGSLASWDEAFYAIASKGILEKGQWLTLYHGNVELFNKPPLYMWITAVFFRIFGVGEFAVRLFSAVSGVLVVLFTYIFAKKVFGRKQGFVSGIILATASHFIIFARRGMLDIPLTLFFILSFYFFWVSRDNPKNMILSGLFFGLAVMTKGAGGVLIPVIIFLYLLLSLEIFKFLSNVYFWLGWVVGLIVFLPWHLYEYVLYGKRFVDDYLLYHVLRRSNEAIEGHSGGSVYYLKKFMQKFKPWSIVAVPSFAFFIYEAVKRKKEYLFFIVWILTVFLFYTLVKTKLQWYVIPMYPAVAIVAGVSIVKVLKGRYTSLVALFGIVVLIGHIFISNIFSMDHSEGIKDLLLKVDAKNKVDYVIYSYQNSEWPAIYYYSDRMPQDVGTEVEMLSILNSKRGCFYLMGLEKYEGFKNKITDVENVIRVNLSKKYVLLEAKPEGITEDAI